ncbi:mechanosensitive ion channel [soil metagenome]
MKDFLNYTLIELGSYSIKVSAILQLIVFSVLVFFILKLIRKATFRSRKFDLAKKYAVYNLIRYFLLVFSIFIGLQILGFNLSVLIAGSAALLVGIGLGLQNLFSDFVSGIILLVDSSIKVNDIIEVNDIVCRVQKINIRTTTVLTRDDKYIILPNGDLTKHQLINWTHSNIASRFEVKIGVDYSSDVLLVMRILKEIGDNQPGILKTPEPFVRFHDYGESSLDFILLFWSEEVFRVDNIKSDLRVKINLAFKKHNITVPFPQRVLHVKKGDLDNK